MKTKILLIVMMFCVFANAQITVTSTDMANVNDTVRFSTSAVNVSTMLNDTGANRTWDFSNLVPNFQDIVSFKSVLNTNIGYYSAFSSSSYGTQDPDISFTLASATNVYSFYTKSTSNYVVDGRGFSVSGLPLTQPYLGKDVVYKFPLAYGNRDTSSYYTNQVNLIVATLASSGKRINVVDGWGTLTTPYGTFNCVRVKSVVQQTDTVAVTQIPFPIPVAHNKTEYKWFTNGKKIPILEIDVTTGTGAATTIKYRDSVRADVFNGLANFAANKTTFTANSNDTCILTSSSLNTPKSYLWTITPSTFSFTGGTSATSVTPKIFFTSNGTYTVTLKVTYNAGSDDTVRVNYITVAQGPTANFGSSVVGNSSPSLTVVNLYDSSTGSPMPNAWKWTFVPNKVSFVGGTTSTSQNPKITFDSATTYAVTLRATNIIGSNSITKNFNVFNTGINDVKQIHEAVTIYPNPADNYFEISINKNEVEHFEMYDITGKLFQMNLKWKDQNTCSIDCSQLSGGIYFVKIFYADKQTSVKKVSVR